LIPLLCDLRGGLAEAAHQALKDLSGQDFGPKANASREERIQAAQQWTEALLRSVANRCTLSTRALVVYCS
jgi:hypothetical protein